jgi:hypothetical protein
MYTCSLRVSLLDSDAGNRSKASVAVDMNVITKGLWPDYSAARRSGLCKSVMRQSVPVAANQVWSVDFMTDALSFAAEVSYAEHCG